MLGKTFILAAFFIGSSTGSFFQGENLIAKVILTTENNISPDLPPTLIFIPTSVPSGLYGSTYKNQTLRIIGGKAPYTFSVSRGDLPKGISLSTDGVLSGTPTAAGSYSFTVTAMDNSKPNKVSGSQDYSLAINRASLTITANDVTTTYGGALPALTASFHGFVNGDNASSLATAPTITTTATASSPAGAYPVSVSGAADPNYNFDYTPGTLHINPTTLSITATAQTKEFGAADPAFTYTSSGLVNGDNTNIFTGNLSRTAGENVGTYPITKGSLSAGNNYTISYTGNNLTITKTSQHISWDQSLLVGCNNTTHMQLTATASSGLPVSYSISDASVATVSGNQLTLLRPGTAVVTASQAGDVNHSAATAVSDTLFYQPASLISQHWNDAIFFDNSSGNFVQWQWYKNGSAVAGATGPYYSETPTLNGQYYVIAMDNSGKHIQSCTLTIAAGAAIPGGIKVHPNPVNAGTQVTVTSNYSSAALQGANLQITDMTGKVRQQITAVQPSMQVTLPSETGIYVIKLLLANGQRASSNVLVVN